MKQTKQVARVGILLFILSAVVIGVGCTKGTSVSQVKEDQKVKIGMSIDSLVIDRWQRDKSVFVTKAKELGADVIVQTANENNEEQMSQIKYLIDQGIDVLVVVPYDAKAIAPVIKLAKKKGIKVMAYDRLIMNADVDVYVSFDNVKVGELMAEYLLKAVPTGNYIIINGSPLDNNSYMFNEGYKHALEKPIDDGQITIIKEVWANDWREEEAFFCVDEALQKGEKIDGIIAANDRLAEAVIQALAERRVAGKIPVVGHDGDLAACQHIVEGTQLMTVYKPIHILAENAAQIALKLAKGEEIETNSTIHNGMKDVPFHMWEPVAVTKDNMMETVVKDEFHKKEDIYRNIPSSQWPQ